MQKSKRKMSNIEKKYMVAGFAFLTPAIVIYLIFAVIPFFDSFIVSFQEWLLPDHPLFTQHDSGCHHGAYLCVRL